MSGILSRYQDKKKSNTSPKTNNLFSQQETSARGIAGWQNTCLTCIEERGKEEGSGAGKEAQRRKPRMEKRRERYKEEGEGQKRDAEEGSKVTEEHM